MGTISPDDIRKKMQAGLIIEARTLLTMNEAAFSEEERNALNQDLTRRLTEAEALVAKAEAMESKGQPEEAKTLYETVLPIASDFPGIREHIKQMEDALALTKAVKRRSRRIRQAAAGTAQKQSFSKPLLGIGLAGGLAAVFLAMLFVLKNEPEKTPSDQLQHKDGLQMPSPRQPAPAQVQIPSPDRTQPEPTPTEETAPVVSRQVQPDVPVTTTQEAIPELKADPALIARSAATPKPAPSRMPSPDRTQPEPAPAKEPAPAVARQVQPDVPGAAKQAAVPEPKAETALAAQSADTAEPALTRIPSPGRTQPEPTPTEEPAPTVARQDQPDVTVTTTQTAIPVPKTEPALAAQAADTAKSAPIRIPSPDRTPPEPTLTEEPALAVSRQVQPDAPVTTTQEAIPVPKAETALAAQSADTAKPAPTRMPSPERNLPEPTLSEEPAPAVSRQDRPDVPVTTTQEAIPVPKAEPALAVRSADTAEPAPTRMPSPDRTQPEPAPAKEPALAVSRQDRPDALVKIPQETIPELKAAPALAARLAATPKPPPHRTPSPDRTQPKAEPALTAQSADTAKPAPTRIPSPKGTLPFTEESARATQSADMEKTVHQLPMEGQNENNEQTYTIQPGDSLSRIALRRFCNMEAWKTLYKRNRKQIANPHEVHPGMVLQLQGVKNRCQPEQ